MGTVLVNDIEIEVGPKDNLVQAAEHAGVEIPHYCWHHDLSVVASCRMCLVEVGEKKPDGTVSMLPRLVPACQTPAKPGTVVRTDTPKVKSAQAQTLEYLLLNHPLDCSICDQAGECYLQDYTFKFGNAHSRLNEPKVHREDKYHIGEQIALFTDRCVMCTRCVRFTREISGTSELQIVSRGSVEEIEVFPGEPCNNKLAGNVVDLCPVGALCSKDFLYKKRVWWLKSQDSVCQDCSTGCSIKVDQNEEKVYRLRPRENPQAQGSFMCDDGRFGWKYIHSELRLTGPRIGRLTSAMANVPPNGSGRSVHSDRPVNSDSPSDRRSVGMSPMVPPPELYSIGTQNGNRNGNSKFSASAGSTNDLAIVDPWPAALSATRDAIKECVLNDARRFVAVLSPMMTCEEAYLLAKYLRSVDKRITLALGPVPVIGDDDRYPKDFKGQPPALDKTKFTIRAEKCPNRRGVESVLNHFQGELIPFENVVQRLQRGEVDGAYLVGGYQETWMADDLASQFSKLNCLIVQDFLRSTLTDGATIVLASAVFAEREGTVINHAGLAQLIRQVIRTPNDVRFDGRLLMELAERRGLFNSAVIRREMAKEIRSFAALADGEIGEQGIFLNQPESILL